MNTILPFLRVCTAFEPEMLALMGEAFETTCAALHRRGVPLAREIVAAAIVDLASRGIANAGELHTGALEILSGRQGRTTAGTRFAHDAPIAAPTLAAPVIDPITASLKAPSPTTIAKHGRLCPICRVTMFGRRSDPQSARDDLFECPLCQTVIAQAPPGDDRAGAVAPAPQRQRAP